MRLVIACLLLTLFSISPTRAAALNCSTLASALTTTGPSAAVQIGGGAKTFQAKFSVTGAGSATVPIEGTVDGTSWDPVFTLNVTNTTTSDSYSTSAATYQSWRANPSAISGTSAAVTISWCSQ